MNKIVEDTLKSRGKWSMKRLTVFVVLVLTLILGAFIVLSDLVLKVEVNKYAQGIFDSLLLFLATLMGVTEFGKKLTNKEIKTEEING
jgi:succinate dehydrogenase hydrophobic anchor subunit